MSRRVVVAGGASGIGFAIASLFVERGDDVAGIDVKPGEAAGFPIVVADLSKAAEVSPAIRSAAERLGGIDIPVQVIWGESDRIAGPEYGRAYADAIPRATYTLLPRTGHLPQLETPEELLGALA